MEPTDGSHSTNREASERNIQIIYSPPVSRQAIWLGPSIRKIDNVAEFAPFRILYAQLFSQGLNTLFIIRSLLGSKLIGMVLWSMKDEGGENLPTKEATYIKAAASGVIDDTDSLTNRSFASPITESITGALNIKKNQRPR